MSKKVKKEAREQRQHNIAVVLELLPRQDYKELRDIGISILRRVRFFAWSKRLTNLMLIHILWHVVSIQEKKANADDADKKFYKQAEMLMRHIADSIAWRAFKFKRAQLRIMSENNPASPINKHEIPEIIRRVSGSRNVLIPHDITNYLRVGDFVEITKQGPVIEEMKTRHAETEKQKTSYFNLLHILERAKEKGISYLMTPQNRRHQVAQDALMENVIRRPRVHGDKIRVEKLGEITDLKFRVKHHHKKVKALLRKAKKAGKAFGCLEPGFYVEIANAHTIIKNEQAPDKFDEENQVRVQYENEKIDGQFLKFSTVDFMPIKGNRFPRNWTPCTVLPFSSETCVDIGLGYININFYINLHTIVKKFEVAGWEAELHEPQSGDVASESKESVTEEIMNFTPEEVLISLKKQCDEEKDYGASVLMTQILMYTSAFYQFDFFVDYANAMYIEFEKSPYTGGRHGMHNCVSEAKVLR